MPSQLELGDIVSENQAANQTDHDDRLILDHGLESPVQEGQQRCQKDRQEVTNTRNRLVYPERSVGLRITRSPRHQETDDAEVGNDDEHGDSDELHGDCFPS